FYSIRKPEVSVRYSGRRLIRSHLCVLCSPEQQHQNHTQEDKAPKTAQADDDPEHLLAVALLENLRNESRVALGVAGRFVDLADVRIAQDFGRQGRFA